jgi:hypothetical protein
MRIKKLFLALLPFIIGTIATASGAFFGSGIFLD